MSEDKKSQKQEALRQVVQGLEKTYGQGTIMPPRGAPQRSARAGRSLGRGRLPTRARGRNFRARVERQDHTHPARHRRSAEVRRRRRLHRRRARLRFALRERHRYRSEEAAHVAAGLRRAGARNRRSPHPLRCGGSSRDRLGRRAGTQGRNRGRYGRFAHGPAGAADEPSAAQADRNRQQDRHHADLHQSTATENWCGLRQSRDHHGRERAQVLRQRSPGCAARGQGHAR